MTRPGSPLSAIFAFLGPFVFALSQSITPALFRSDTPLRASLTAEPLLQGGPAAELARLFQALPLGASSGRGTTLSALAAGLSGLFLYRIARALSARQGGTSRIDPWLALGASWATTLSPAWLTESTVLGGAAVGAALSLGLISALLDPPELTIDSLFDKARSQEAPRDETSWLSVALFSALLGTSFAESAWAGAAVLLVLFFEAPRGLRTQHKLTAFGLTTLFAALWLSPLWGRSAPVRTWSLTLGEPFPWSLGRIVEQIGVLFGLAALAGFVLGLGRARSGLFAVLLVLLFDLCAPLTVHSQILSLETATSRHALHLVALGLWATAAVLGLRQAAEGSQALRLFGASTLRPLVVVLIFTTVFAGAEDARSYQAQVPTEFAQRYTDELLGGLPPRALLLTSSTQLTGRLLTAQAEGERPDVLLVPLEKLGEIVWMRRLLEREPLLDPLIRDLNSAGAPSEHALNVLADARPVFVEADARWDRRLLEHLLPSPFLPRFSPHALGRSDRLAAWNAELPRIEALTRDIQGELSLDHATLTLLSTEIAKLEAAIRRAGDGKIADLVLAERERIDALVQGRALKRAPSGAEALEPALPPAK